MPSRIDDKTMVPLGIVAVLFSIGISITATGAFWVKGVNDRLYRIEQKMGITSAPESLIPNANAGELHGPKAH